MKFKTAATGLLIVFLNLFIWQRIGTAAVVMAVSGIWIWVLAVRGYKPVKISATVTTLGMFAGYILLNRAGGFSEFLVFITWLVSIMAGYYLLGAEKNRLAGLVEAVIAVFEFCNGWISEAVNLLKNSGKKQPVWRGLVLGLPIVFVLTMLLAAGDPVFGSYFKFSSNWERPLVHLILSAIWLVIFLPAAFVKFKEIKIAPLLHLVTSRQEMRIILGMVAVVLGAFLAVQWNYVFVRVAAETSLAKYGVATYSEYVKRGFGEFILATLIVYSLIRIGRNIRWEKWILSAELGIFLISVLRRVYLYQAFHGWTLARIYGGLFLIWVAGMLLLLGKFKWEVRWTILAILATGWFNAEGFILKTRPPTVNNRTDYVYLSRLSADGYEGWKMAANYAEGILNRDYNTPLINSEQRREILYAGIIQANLARRYNNFDSNYSQGTLWQRLLVLNFAEKTAWEKMKKEIPWNRIKIMLDKSDRLQERINSQPENERYTEIDYSDGPIF